MSHYPLNKLLLAVNEVAKRSSVEELRESVTMQLKDVYQKVGAEALFHPAIQLAEPNDYDYVELSPLMTKLIDVHVGQPSVTGGRINTTVSRIGKILEGQRFVDYVEMENRLYFHDGPLFHPLTITYWTLPVDREGAPLVDDRIYQAAVLYCQSEVARVNLHFINKQSYSGLPMQVDAAAANREMDWARGHCNELGTPDFVRLYNSLRGIRSMGRSDILNYKRREDFVNSRIAIADLDPKTIIQQEASYPTVIDQNEWKTLEW